ncbi:MAG: hypothetical protein IAE79_06975 [Anaerolinea sp.]|nr:hypothetical protein [Anaerolinea sp.]
MVQLTVQLPDRVAKKINPQSPWLAAVFELNLTGFHTLAAGTAAEVTRFLMKNPSAQEVMNFHVPEPAQTRLRRLLTLNEAGLLAESEQLELDELEQIEHMIIMLKAQATD